MKHRARQFDLPAMPPEKFSLSPETASPAMNTTQPSQTPGTLFHTKPTFKPTKLDKHNRKATK